MGHKYIYIYITITIMRFIHQLIIGGASPCNMFLSWNHGISINIIWSQILFWLQAIKSPWANQQQQGRFKEKPTRLARRWSLVAQRSEQLRHVAQRRKGPQNWTSTDNVNFHYAKVFQNWAGFFFPNIVYIYILLYIIYTQICCHQNFVLVRKWGDCGWVYTLKKVTFQFRKPWWTIWTKTFGQ